MLEFINQALNSPVVTFLLAAGFTAMIIRNILTTSSLRSAAKSKARFIDEYAKYDPKGAKELDQALINWHLIAAEELKKNNTDSSK